MKKYFRNKKWKKIIKESGMFDVKYYLFTYPDLRQKGLDPVMHYIVHGADEGRNPSEEFSTSFYINHYPDVKEAEINPLVHYILHGKDEKKHINEDEVVCLIIEESGMFDEKYYLSSNEDLKGLEIDLIKHYVAYGVKEGRNPSEEFETKFYLEQYEDVKDTKINPFMHYILFGKEESRVCKNSVLEKVALNDSYIRNLFYENNNSSTEYCKYQEHEKIITDIKLIAFYLPQFHPLEVNDKAWGKGFTEWTNVSKALPQFEGHYQPRLPGELGYYDLRLIDVQKRQIELAKNYGLHGFCYHYYWFDGEKIMDKPLQQILDNPDLDFPFCINWANENWTKRWDGLDNEVILKQNHSEKDDLEFLEAIKPILTDSRYIKVDGKALLMIYRPKLFPDIKATVKRWRTHARKIGIGELYLVLTHSFDNQDPREICFDAAVEFSPNNFPAKNITTKIEKYNNSYKGAILDYDSVVEHSNSYVKPEYIKFRGITPSWDNEARKPGKGTSYFNANPKKFKQWLNTLIEFTEENHKKDEKIIFINAWNEWAEGAYLEPDRKYGYAYLESIYQSLYKKQEKSKKKIIYVSHDAHFHGAQILSLNIIRVLHNLFKLDVHMIIKSGGELEKDFKKYATVYNLEKNYPSSEDKSILIKSLFNNGNKHAICNTVVSGDILKLLSTQGIKTISLIHELPNLIKRYGMEDNALDIANYAKHVIFASNFVKDKFKTVVDIDNAKLVTSPQGLYQINHYKNDLESARIELRKELKISENAKIVLGAGFADHRKGIDLFVEVAIKCKKTLPNTYFVWVGNIEQNINKTIKKDYNLNDANIIFVSALPEISLFFAGADIYLMTSREDPFPSVVLEAMNVKVPVIGFKGAGGFQDVVTEECGVLVEYENINSMADAVTSLLKNKEKIKLMGVNSEKLIKEKFRWEDYIYNLLDLLDMSYKKVSVIVPNYNYERYIESRLKSIEMQNYPIYELIYLEDYSKDNSLEIAEDFLKKTTLNMSIIANKVNSGSVFKQWHKGINSVSGDYIWIAEADDLAEPLFLEKVMKGFNDDEVVLSYTQSKQIDEKGKLIAENYLEYTNDIDRNKWLSNYIRDGKEEIRDTLVIKNTIPNVSAVVFKKFDVSSIIEKLLTFKVGGDWYFYVWLLNKGKVSYIAKSLNLHRRHTSSVTVSSENNLKHFQEIVEMQELITETTDVSEKKWKTALKYREQIKEYFDLQKRIKKI